MIYSSLRPLLSSRLKSDACSPFCGSGGCPREAVNVEIPLKDWILLALNLCLGKNSPMNFASSSMKKASPSLDHRIIFGDLLASWRIIVMSLCGNGTDRVVDLTLEVSHILLSSNSKEKEEEHDQHCRNNMIMINKIIISSYNQLLLASEDLSRSLRLFHARSSVKLLYPHLTTSAAVCVRTKC